MRFLQRPFCSGRKRNAPEYPGIFLRDRPKIGKLKDPFCGKVQTPALSLSFKTDGRIPCPDLR